MKSPKLIYNNQYQASFYIWVNKPDTKIELLSDKSLCFDVSPDNNIIKQKTSCNFLKEGIFTVTLLPLCDNEVQIVINAEIGAVPFLIPAPGIIPSHLNDDDQPALYFAWKQDLNLFFYLSDILSELHMTATSLLGSIIKSNEVEVQLEDIALPEDARCVNWKNAELKKISPGWYKWYVPGSDRLPQVTISEGVPLFMIPCDDKKPPFGCFKLRAIDKNENSIDARFTFYQNNKIVAQRDLINNEDENVYVVKGTYEILITQGHKKQKKMIVITIEDGQYIELKVKLDDGLVIKKGWVLGDLHLHSVYEDAAVYPSQVMKAARANGANFACLTDYHPEDVVKSNICDYNIENYFLALPGQELMNSFMHMNAINTRISLDPAKNVDSWLNSLKKMTKSHPNILMLNHPLHKEPAYSNAAYFRSWWVHDKYEDVSLVENCDFTSWFDRLNQGRRTVCIWTTDSHDALRLAPSKKGCYVYIGDTLNEHTLIDGIRAGRVFNTAYPGALLYLTVNDKTLGETVEKDMSIPLNVKISCQAATPIQRVELIGDGKIIKTFSGQYSKQMNVKLQLDNNIKWIIARCFSENTQWNEISHSGDLMRMTGCTAFTNPIYIDNKEN